MSPAAGEIRQARRDSRALQTYPRAIARKRHWMRRRARRCTAGPAPPVESVSAAASASESAEEVEEHCVQVLALTIVGTNGAAHAHLQAEPVVYIEYQPIAQRGNE